MGNKILVVGGYGQVGSVISMNLAVQYPNRVIVAGRNIEKAKKLANLANNNIIPMEVDIYNHRQVDEVLTDVCVVIMCMEMSETYLVEKCVAYAIDYIDISPSFDILSRIAKYHEDAVKSKCKIVLGVGIAPGISNLLAKKAIKQLDEVISINNYLMLGVGEKHGTDAIKWLTNHINRKFILTTDFKKTQVKSFTNGKKILLEKENKHRTFYRIDLADWHIMSKTLKAQNVATWFTYDLDWLTKQVALLQKIGLFHFIHHKNFQRIYIRVFSLSMALLQKLHIGTAKYAVQVEVVGLYKRQEKTITLSVSGLENSKITGLVASIVGSKLIENNEIAFGVNYLEDILTIEEINSTLK